jgi:hypothetical protein
MGFSDKNILAGGPGRVSTSPDPFEACAPLSSKMWRGAHPLAELVGRGLWLRPFDMLDWANWVKTETGTCTETPYADGVPVTSVLVTAAAESDGHNMQFSKDGGTTPWECFQMSSGMNAMLEFSFKLDNAADTADVQSKGELGVVITDTTINGGVTDGAYFRLKDGDANIYCVTEKNSTETEEDSGVDISNDTYVTLGLKFLGNAAVEFWVNNVLRKTIKTNIPDDEALAPSFALHTGMAAAMTSTFRSICGYVEQR